MSDLGASQGFLRSGGGAKSPSHQLNEGGGGGGGVGAGEGVSMAC